MAHPEAGGGRWHIALVRPAGYAHSSAFDDVCEGLGWALVRLGFCVSFGENEIVADARNVVVGAHLLSAELALRLADLDVVVYNFEQIPTQLGVWRHYEPTLLRLPVWDYREEHVRWLKARGNPRVRHLPFGYTPRLERVPPAATAEFDVLFLGSVTPRRQAVLDALQRAGLRVAVASHERPAYGLGRDLLLARSLVVLNVHQYEEDDPIEELRLLYAFANHRPVVSEARTLAAVPPAWREAALFVPYGELVDACLALVADAGRREALAHAGYAAARARDFTAALGRLLAAERDAKAPIEADGTAGRAEEG